MKRNRYKTNTKKYNARAFVPTDRRLDTQIPYESPNLHDEIT